MPDTFYLFTGKMAKVSYKNLEQVGEPYTERSGVLRALRQQGIRDRKRILSVLRDKLDESYRSSTHIAITPDFHDPDCAIVVHYKIHK